MFYIYSVLEIGYYLKSSRGTVWLLITSLVYIFIFASILELAVGGTTISISVRDGKLSIEECVGIVLSRDYGNKSKSVVEEAKKEGLEADVEPVSEGSMVIFCGDNIKHKRDVLTNILRRALNLSLLRINGRRILGPRNQEIGKYIA
jgi:hypothetical protein